MRTGVRFCPNGHNVLLYSCISMVHIETYIKSVLIVVQNNITERKADNAYVISIFVLIFIYSLDYSFILSYFCRKNSIKSYKQYL